MVIFITIIQLILAVTSRPQDDWLCKKQNMGAPLFQNLMKKIETFCIR
jgi:hypothetical protein